MKPRQYRRKASTELSFSSLCYDKKKKKKKKKKEEEEEEDLFVCFIA